MVQLLLFCRLVTNWVQVVAHNTKYLISRTCNTQQLVEIYTKTNTKRTNTKTWTNRHSFTCKNCLYESSYDYAQLLWYTVGLEHGTVLIIFAVILQTHVTVQMLSIGGEGMCKIIHVRLCHIHVHTVREATVPGSLSAAFSVNHSEFFLQGIKRSRTSLTGSNLMA